MQNKTRLSKSLILSKLFLDQNPRAQSQFFLNFTVVFILCKDWVLKLEQKKLVWFVDLLDYFRFLHQTRIVFDIARQKSVA